MSVTAKRQVTGKILAAKRRDGPRSRGPVRLGGARTRRPNTMYEWLTEGTEREFRGGKGPKIKKILQAKPLNI